ncbi:hypothetical protein PoB_000158400 [Plakobranchus ocellatus]|uniref:Uncharacterized protein n=1 Tax=Plakobranchus ocellatus TaxID=259542 RepID=A0AAV3XYR1_9GAST|nr:hypothetical protein PoB_000158400 [Plakobranchus ocellatus]
MIVVSGGAVGRMPAFYDRGLIPSSYQRISSALLCPRSLAYWLARSLFYRLHGTYSLLGHNRLYKLELENRERRGEASHNAASKVQKPILKFDMGTAELDPCGMTS